MKVVVLVADQYRWALKPFAYLFNKFWSELQEVVVAGYTPPDELPQNFSFFQIDSNPYPASKWTDGLIRVLDHTRDDKFVLMLEDYWLTRTVDTRGVSACMDYMANIPNVLRFDLTTDRQYNGRARDLESWGSYDIVETPFDAEYQVSTQAGIWDTHMLRRILIPGRDAWQFEIETHTPPRMRVFGTRQWPVRYINALRKGAVDLAEIHKLPEEHYDYIMQKGWIP